MRLSKVLCDARSRCHFATTEVRDGFFLPLVKHATTAEAVSWLSRAMCDVIDGGGADAAQRVAIFATEAVRDGFLLPLVKHATSEEACQRLSSAMCNITAGTDVGAARRKDIFATATVRDGFFLPLVKYATSAKTVEWLSGAMCDITAENDSCDVRSLDTFATNNVRDGFFLPLVKHATSNEACQRLSSAMCNITAGTSTAAARRKDTFATNTVRDGFFLPLAKRATSVARLAVAMCNITAGPGAAHRKAVFGTEAVRDGFFLPLAKHAASDEACQLLSEAMASITDTGANAPCEDIFATEAVRDGFFLPLVKYATSDATCRWLSSAMCNITVGTDAGAARRMDIFATRAVCERFFVPLVKHATSAEARRWLTQACRNVSRPNPASGFWWWSSPESPRATTFATPAMRDHFFLPLAQNLPRSGQENAATTDLLLTTFSAVVHEAGSPKNFVTPQLACEFARLLHAFKGVSKTAQSVGELYPLIRCPLRSNASVVETDIPKNTEPFWALEKQCDAALNGQIDDYARCRYAKGLQPLTFIVVGATAVHNPVLEKRFEIMKSMLEKGGRSKLELRERCGFHGTHPENIDKILTTSLLPSGHPLNPCERKTDEGWFGDHTAGVYVGRYVDYVLKYSNNNRPLKPGDEVKVIMFKTLPGKSKHIEKVSRGVKPTPGYDSHSSPEYLEWYLFEPAQLCPTHVLRVLAVENKRTKTDDGSEL